MSGTEGSAPVLKRPRPRAPSPGADAGYSMPSAEVAASDADADADADVGTRRGRDREGTRDGAGVEPTGAVIRREVGARARVAGDVAPIAEGRAVEEDIATTSEMDGSIDARGCQ